MKTSDPETGWMTEAKDWAGELISGQTTTGRILVSDHLFIFFSFTVIDIDSAYLKVLVEKH